jgi:16S rRNA (cytidine1402-2'-O)-methyltransferase
VSGTLYVVATPIGNLDDLTPRARQVLADVDRIAAEDTRHTGRLLTHIGAKTPQTPLHEFNEEEVTESLVEALRNGADIALVSDAGTPLVSDPGYRLVAAARAAAIRTVPVPGACAVIAALSVAGLATDRFCFEGFLPNRAGARQRRLSTLVSESRTLVFFEAVHRVAATVAGMADVFGPERRAVVARELTKLYEQVVDGTLGELASQLEDGSLASRGEFVIVVAGNPEAEARPAIDVDGLLLELVKALPGSEAAAIVARATGESRNVIYRRMLALKESR